MKDHSKITFSSLRVRLLLLILVVILPILGMIAYHGFENRTKDRVKTLAEVGQLANGAAMLYEHIIIEARNILSTLAQMPRFRERDSAACSEILADVLRKSPYFTGYTAIRPDGEVFAAAPAMTKPIHFADRPWFRRLLQSRDFVIGEYLIGRLSGKPTVILGYPVLDQAERPETLFAIGLDLEALQKRLLEMDLPDGANLTVVDSEGTILMRFPDPGGFVGRKMRESSLINTVLNANKEGGTAEEIGLNGVPRLYGYKRIGHASEAIYVIVGIPESIVYAALRQRMIRDVTLLVLVAVLALAGAWIFGKIWFMAPVDRLVGFTKRLADGDLTVRVDPLTGTAELAMLASNFNHMAEKLQRRHEDEKRAQEMIAKSEERFRKAFYTSPDAVNINRLTDGMYVSINPGFTRITGYTEEEIVGKSSIEFNIWHNSEDRQRLVEGLRRNGQVNNLEAVFQMKSGELRDGLMSATIIDLDDTPHILSITRDITERKRMEDALRESEQKYRWVVDNTADVITVTDMDLRFTYVSPSILRLRGFTAEEAMAQTMDQVMTPESIRVIAEAFEEEMKLEAGGTADPGRSRILELQEYRKDGSIVWVENTMSYIRDENLKPLGFISVSRDITGRKQNEERLKGRLRQLAALREIDMAITGSLDMRVTLSVFLDQVTETLGVDAADVLLLDPYSHRLAFAAGRGFLTDALRHTNISLGEGFAGQAARDRRTISVPDLRKEGTELLRKSPLLSNEKFVSYYCAPLIAKGHVKGVLEIFNRTPLNPDPEWMDYLEALATQAAIAIDNAALFDDLQKSNLEIVLSYDSTLEGWARALDMRDRETEGHSRRVTEMTVKIAKKMGIRNSELVHVRRGALLHDIGKMGIPDSILLKPGDLNEEEWKIMRNHPGKAYELLSPISYLRPALDIPYAHHEKWDGTGYPRGLKGEQIPLAARIFAIVDTWDALRSDRPYRSAWPEQKAIEHIKEQAGRHFDPELARVFLESLDELKGHDQPPVNIPAGS